MKRWTASSIRPVQKRDVGGVLALPQDVGQGRQDKAGQATTANRPLFLSRLETIVNSQDSRDAFRTPVSVEKREKQPSGRKIPFSRQEIKMVVSPTLLDCNRPQEDRGCLQRFIYYEPPC